MQITIHESAQANGINKQIYFGSQASDFESILNQQEYQYAISQFSNTKSLVAINRYETQLWFVVVNEKNNPTDDLEACRKAGHAAFAAVLAEKTSQVWFHFSQNTLRGLAFLEGFLLSAYRFDKYLTKSKKADEQLTAVFVAGLSNEAIFKLGNLIKAVYLARDWVNEPQNVLNAITFADSMAEIAEEAGIRAEILERQKIETLKMGGLLAVNRGSITDPTFTILEWKPANAINQKPYVLVGKGLVYDTGGLSLKPTPGSMDSMKCDMAGGAAAAAAIYAVALNKLPIHVVALIPATDNRPGGDAYTPGDVITMFNGLTVEVLNTDAEGRLILADALAYADKFKPELVIDLATLTGAAVMAVGPQGTVCMGTAATETMQKLKNAGEQTFERLAELPFWDEYDDLIKSDIADMKNIGGRYAGSITAGKFLARYINYPWIHLDIAGPAFLEAPSAYRPKNGTGIGVRLLYQFFENIVNEAQ